MAIQGHVSIARDDGEWSMFQNKIMADHIPAIPNALAGDSDGIITTMGIGTNTEEENAINLKEMKSEIDENSTVTYTDVNAHGPVINLENSDIEVESKDFIDHSGAIFLSGTFGEASHRRMDGKEISEIALFTGDKDYMFARTVIPTYDRIFKLRNQAVKISWMIFYGVEEADLTRKDWLGDGYGFMYGRNYGQ